jgi:hypothetical protein
MKWASVWLAEPISLILKICKGRVIEGFMYSALLQLAPALRDYHYRIIELAN